MKRTFSTELAYVFGIVFVARGVVLMEKADFGVSMVVAPAYLLYRWLSPVWSFVTFGMAEYRLQAVLLLAMCLLLRFRVSYLFSFVTAVVYGFVLDAFMLLGAALPAGSVWLRVIYYVLGMLFCAAGVSAMFHTYSKHIRCPDTRSKCAFQPCGQTAHFDFWDAPKPCLIFAKSPWIRGIARELNDIFAMTLFCDFEASQAAISTWLYLLIMIAIEIDDPGPVFFSQKRVGIHKKYFQLYKFRSMKMSTPHDMPTHLLENPEQYITRVGKFLRKTSLDEIPQLWNILRGDMSVIGPRPALWNQEDLLAERDKYGANDVKPGLSGWAQICGRDELEIADKARLDGEYVQRMSFGFDCRCFFGTAISALRGDGVVEGGTGELHRMENKK